MLTALTMLPLGAIMVALSIPIVRVIYERGAFNRQASGLVASLLVAYGIGMFFYLGRDVLVRVFYALGDADTPFRISIFNIFLNALLDFILIKPFGAPGLVLATMGVNFTSMILLLWYLNKKINGLPLQQWLLPFGGLTGASVITGFASWGTNWGLQQFLGTEGLLIQLLELCLAGFVGLCLFAFFAIQMKLPEVDIFMARIRQKFFK
jgi:putative peptidoglycan lipid II flippase